MANPRWRVLMVGSLLAGAALAQDLPAATSAPAPPKFSWGLGAYGVFNPETSVRSPSGHGLTLVFAAGPRLWLGVAWPGRVRLSALAEGAWVTTGSEGAGEPPPYEEPFNLDFSCGFGACTRPPARPPVPTPSTAWALGVGAEAALLRWTDFEPYVRWTYDRVVASSLGAYPLANDAWSLGLGARLFRVVDVTAVVGQSYVGAIAFGIGFGLGYVTRD